MTTRALLLIGGVSLAFASIATAQSVGPPAANANPPPVVEAPATVPASPAPAAASVPPIANVPATLNQPGLPPQRIRAMVRASGFDPIGPPVHHGNLYVQRALDPDAIEYRVVVDPLSGRIVSVRPLRSAGPYAYGPRPYRPYPPPYRPAYGRYYGPPPGDFGYGYGAPLPPRNIPLARLSVPQSQLPPPSPPPQPPPQQSHQVAPPSQPSTTAQAPLPRPKPYVMESTGSIPIDSAKPLASPTTAEPPAGAPQNNGAAALPPVAPLD